MAGMTQEHSLMNREHEKVITGYRLIATEILQKSCSPLTILFDVAPNR